MQTELELEIKKHRALYWDESNPEITDAEYDILIEQLRAIDPDNYLLKTPELGEDIQVGDKIAHEVPMLSLEKKYSFKEVKTWCNGVSRIDGEFFIIMPKFDGCAARYYIKTNKLATRGDGEFGQDITNKLPLITNVDFKTLSENSKIDYIDGEIVISFEDFKNCNLINKSSTRYKNPRNLVSGILNLNEIEPVLGKVKLSFIDYNSIKLEVMNVALIEKFFNEAVNTTSQFPTDGLVIKLKDKPYGETLGATSHHYRSAIAFKNQDKEYVTKIRDIILGHGKNKLTPVAVLDPVDIDGVTVTKASLHNCKNILDHNIQIGDTAHIIRSNSVIPYIVRTEPGETRQNPVFNKCSNCGSSLDYREPDLFCTNPDCNGNLIQKLAYAVACLDIDFLAATTVEKMIYELNVENLFDILTLTLQDLLELTGFGYTSADKLLQNIERAKSGIEDFKLLAALNIPGIGRTIFKSIMAKVNISELLTTNLSDLMNFEGLGPERSMNIYKSLSQKRLLLDQLRNIINVIETKKTIGTTIRPKICMSGTFPSPKDFYQRIAMSLGYEVVESVTRDLAILVTSGALTSKYTKARNMGIKILTADEFLKLGKK